jgi:hypothetical protein
MEKFRLISEKLEFMKGLFTKSEIILEELN